MRNYSPNPREGPVLSGSPGTEDADQSETFFEQLSRLSEIASDMVNTFYAPQERFTSRRLAARYAQYKEWYQNIPSELRLENTALPQVLALHMYFYACILQ